MSKWTVPRFELGPFEIDRGEPITTDDSEEASIYFEDEFENYSIEVKCESAGRIAACIVTAVNNHDALVKALQAVREARMPGEARRIAAEALRALVGGSRE